MKSLIKFSILLITILFSFSCRSVLYRRYQMNREFDFSTKKSYLNYLVEKRHLIPEYLYYFDKVSYNIFLNQFVQDKKSQIYFGTFLNDSISFIKSPYLKNNETCIGRMASEIAKNLSESTDNKNITESVINFKSFRLISLFNGKILEGLPANQKKKLIVFVDNYYGSYFDSFYKEVQEIQKKEQQELDLIIILIDPVSYLKN